MPMIERECQNCESKFKTHPCQVKRGGGKYCSLKCTRTHKNRTNNPSKRPEVKAKISRNHADVSGEKNPMHGKRGEHAPGYKDGRSKYHSYYRMVALKDRPPICEICGADPKGYKLHVHHKDKDRENDAPENLQVVCSKCHRKLHPEHNNKPRDEKGRFIKTK